MDRCCRSSTKLRSINDALSGKVFPNKTNKTFKDLPTPKRKSSKKIRRMPKHKSLELTPQGSPACSVAKQLGIRAFLVQQADEPMGDGESKLSAL